VQAQPEGYPTISPGLAVRGAADAIEFYKSVLGATERMRMPNPDGGVAHAELEIGDSLIMLSDEFPDMDFHAPGKYGGSPVNLNVYVGDVDAVFARAVAAGARAVREPEDQFYGDRSGQFEDPWGHRWNVATHVEDVSPDEMERRVAQFMSGG